VTSKVVKGLVFATFTVLLAPGAAPVAWGQAGILAADEARTFTAALEAARKARWGEAGRLAAASKDPLPAKVVDWLRLKAADSGAAFAEIAAFLEANPDWPEGGTLRTRAEQAIDKTVPAAVRLAWFDRYPPLSVEGRVAHAEALRATGRAEEAREALRATWVEGRFDRHGERAFLLNYRKLLTPEDHRARLDRLLWNRQYSAARRLLRRVDKGHQALAQARIELGRMGGGVDWAVAQVPKALLNDPGLVYERLRWRVRKDLDDRARELLERPPAGLGRPDLWWRQREILARRLLEDGDAEGAYRLVAGHGQQPGSVAYAEAEWLAGWLALRFLGRAEDALAHFTDMQAAVRQPISLARAAYWTAQAATALQRAGVARTFYARAARHGATFYGQLAVGHLEPHLRPEVPEPPVVERAALEAFAGRELVRAARILADVGRDDLADSFLRALLEKADSRSDHLLVAILAQELERPDLAIRTAKRAVAGDAVFLEQGYPTDAAGVELLPERALVLAVIRQESAFDAAAVSRAGARGLMQLMPRTAQRVARSARLPFSRHRLTADPAYNVRLGSAYLNQMLERFRGSYPLALAAYNAGPYRVDRWLEAFGDPRAYEIDIVDWIELIPFGETRNYVQRVMEAVDIYRRRLVGTQVALTILEDLGAAGLGPR